MYPCYISVLRWHPRNNAVWTRKAVQGSISKIQLISQKNVQNDVFFIFPSTNLVFDGSVPFRKSYESRSPMTEYGRQKAEAEKQLISLGENVAIVRFTKIISPETPLIRMWCDNIRSSRPIYPFSNYVMSPVPNLLAGEILYRIAQKRICGIHQVSGPQDISYAEAAYHIAKRLHVEENLVRPTTIEDAGVAIEYNPAFTTLDSTETERKVGIHIPDAFTSLDHGVLSWWKITVIYPLFMTQFINAISVGIPI